MSGPDGVDLFRLEDVDGGRCVVRVTGPGGADGDGERVLRADVLVHADFVDARLELFLGPGDLDAWRWGLDGLDLGKGFELGDRGVSLALQPYEDGYLIVTVQDPERLSVVLWIRPRAGWTDEHRERLEQVRRAWPGGGGAVCP
ncbi:hypothetical protein HUT16_07875 [Kitasatospora sp. NA04385]|uniref:DUF5959 family protein n=1 Tax=Kitasatospora sp. NA04385 TaxID=2742135 RepID=UPI00158FF563|nr:DUF5959 family protein [Kitasatospora sp. NA04385]QKW18993.1 hypothetical protein HUT16_07875 [Kitasatospora sp. NA04385]